MFKPVSMSAESLRSMSAPSSMDGANDVFKAFHGMYGNLFLTKYTSGKKDENGRDEGIKSARLVWAQGLQTFDADTIRAALARCLEQHQEFPPSLPQFIALCRACKPRDAYKPAVTAIGMSQGLRSQYARQARAINEKHQRKAMEKATGYKPLPMTLDGLKQAIANAVGCAGGDEVATLRRLDLELRASE